MRPGQGSKRSRGRGRKPQNNFNRTYDSNGPDIKIRGSANHINEKYLSLARDANAAGDRVTAENYLQHAEHYFRIMMLAQLSQNGQIARPMLSSQPGDEDAEDSRMDRFSGDYGREESNDPLQVPQTMQGSVADENSLPEFNSGNGNSNNNGYGAAAPAAQGQTHDGGFNPAGRRGGRRRGRGYPRMGGHGQNSHEQNGQSQHGQRQNGQDQNGADFAEDDETSGNNDSMPTL
jgi:hypothetical protein